MKTFITVLLSMLLIPISAQTISVTGTVTDEFESPLAGASILIAGSTTGTETDREGDFTIDVAKGKQLVVSYIGMETQRITITGPTPLKINMIADIEIIEVTLRTYGKPRPFRELGVPISVLTAADLENKPEPDIVRSMIGKVAGVQITGTAGNVGSGTNFTIRSKSSITGDNQPLFVVDGMPFSTSTNDIAGFAGGGAVTSSRFLDLDPNNIASVKVLKGLSAAILYGQDGRNGVVLIETKTGTFTDENLAPDIPFSQRFLKAQEQARLKLANERTIDEIGLVSPYQNIIKDLNNAVDKYKDFLAIQQQYSGDPQFYIDVYDRFKTIDPEFASEVLFEIHRVKSDDIELLKALAFKLEAEEEYAGANELYRRILKLRPNDPQSYRDLALGLHNSGAANEALQQLTVLFTQEMDDDFATVIGHEMIHMLKKSEVLNQKYQVGMDEVASIQNDLRIVADWNLSDTNLDLQVIDPNLEIANSENTRTRAGGVLSTNNSTGYGPEIFSMDKLLTGSYYLKMGYPDNSTSEERRPAYVKLTIFRNYGRSNETSEVQLIYLSAKEELQLLDRIAAL